MKTNNTGEVSAAIDNDTQRVAQAIIDALAQFDIQIKLEDILVGAAFTRYVYSVLSRRTRMSDISRRADDIKYSIQATEGVMVYAPIAGTSYVGIEVANAAYRPIELSDLLTSPDFVNAKGDLVFAFGEDVFGKTAVADLTKLPHLLVAGTTRSGKSVFINDLIVSLIYKYSPDYVRFLIADTKFTELSAYYDGMPHMLVPCAVKLMPDILAGIDYLIDEMERRYNLFRQNNVTKISEYNNLANSKSEPRLPYLVLIVDEISNIMSVDKMAFETRIVRLAQKSRAAGIHIVLSTQRANSDTVSGSIKANIPARIAFRVHSSYDSQIVLGSGGAEKLIGCGDSLFMDSCNPYEPKRVQCAYISKDDVLSLIERSKQIDGVHYDEAIADKIYVSFKPLQGQNLCDSKSVSVVDNEDIIFYKKALRYWLERNNGKASIASIQRGLGIGFNRAGRILEDLQRMGYVDTPPADQYGSSRPLTVLVALEELDTLFPDTDDTD